MKAKIIRQPVTISSRDVKDFVERDALVSNAGDGQDSMNQQKHGHAGTDDAGMDR